MHSETPLEQHQPDHDSPTDKAARQANEREHADFPRQQESALGVMLLSGTHDRAHYAFVVASGAAALGRKVVLFATNRGCAALCQSWTGLLEAARDERIQARGVAGLEILRDACLEMNVRMIACEAGLRAEALDACLLLPEVEIAGIATFLSAVGTGQIITI